MLKVKHLIKRDSDGRVIAEFFTSVDNCDFDSVEVKYKYDSDGNLSERSVFLPDSAFYSSRTTYKYDSEKRLVSELIEKIYNKKTITADVNQYVYDSHGNLCKWIFGKTGAKIIINYTYGSNAEVVKKECTINGENRKIYNYYYDTHGILIRKKCTDAVTGFSECEKEIFYNSDGNVTKTISTDHNNIQTFTELYYSDGNPVKTVTSYSDTESKREFNYEYDSRGRKTVHKYINPYNELLTTQFIYDEFGNEVFSFVFDEKSRLTEINISDIKTEIFQYSLDKDQLIKHKISYYNKPQQVITYYYDSNGNMIKELLQYNGKKSSIENFYDDNNNLIKRIITGTDRKSVIRQYEYNAENIMIKESLTDNDGKTVKWSYSYNQNGEIRVEIDNTENAKYDIDVCGDLFPEWAVVICE